MGESTGLLSKGTTLGYKATAQATTYSVIDNVQEVPEMGGKPDKADVTTLADGTKRYIAGLSDPGELAFKFLYDNSSATAPYRVLQGLSASKATTPFEVAYPDGTKHDFTAQVSVAMDAAKSGDPLTFTATMMLNSAISVVHPAG